MKKKLLICPSCEQNGTINILGEIRKDGSFVVLRFHQGETIVNGDSFIVVCGICKKPIYVRKKNGSMLTRFDYHWQYLESK